VLEMEMPTIIKSIISLFIIMLVGVYGGKKQIITTEVNRGLTDILLQIALPFMIISSFSFSYDEAIKGNIIKTFCYSFLAYIIIGIVSYILTKPIEKEKRVIIHFANIFTNTGYIGFPILNAIYGAEAVIYGSIFNVFFTVFLWTYGIMIFKGRIEKKELRQEILKSLLNPSIIAVYIGIIMIVFNIKFPDVIRTTINSIGNMTAPMSMIIVGAISSNVSIKGHLKDWTIYYGIITKIIIIPAALFIISLLIRDRSIVSNSIIILASMPPAIMTSIFAERFKIQKDYATIIVVLTTLLSIFILPILLKLII
jgi:malate permease and related proteins